MSATLIKGTKDEVFAGIADHTPGGLMAVDLVLNAKGKVVSRKASEAAKARFANSTLANETGGGAVGGSLSVGKGARRALKRSQIREQIAAERHNGFELQMGGSLSVGKGARRALKRAEIRERIEAIRHNALQLQMGGSLIGPAMKKRLEAIYHHAEAMMVEHAEKRRERQAEAEADDSDEEHGGGEVGGGEVGGSLSVGKGARRALKRSQIREAIAAQRHNAFELQMGRPRN